MKKIAIIKCGETHPSIKTQFGDFEDWIIQAANLPSNSFTIYNVFNGDLLWHPDEFCGAIIAGSELIVADNSKWMKQLINWIVTARYTNLPVLGICFGAQIMAEALGGKLGLNEPGLNIGAVEVAFTSTGKTDAIFKGLGDTLETFALHRQCIRTLPLGADLLAFGKKSSIQVFRIGKLYGVQFHPEFTEEIMKAYIENQTEVNTHKIKSRVRFEYRNQKVISNFVGICVKS